MYFREKRPKYLCFMLKNIMGCLDNNFDFEKVKTKIYGTISQLSIAAGIVPIDGI